MFYCFWESTNGVGAERRGQMIWSRLCTDSSEPLIEFELINCEWDHDLSEVDAQPTEPPRCPYPIGSFKTTNYFNVSPFTFLSSRKKHKTFLWLTAAICLLTFFPSTIMLSPHLCSFCSNTKDVFLPWNYCTAVLSALSASSQSSWYQFSMAIQFLFQMSPPQRDFFFLLIGLNY